MIKLKDLLVEGPFDQIQDMERFVERRLTSTLKRHGSVDTDTSNMIVSYRGRIGPNIRSGSEYDSLKNEIKNFISKIKRDVQKQNGTISFDYIDEWVGFDIRLKEIDYKDPKTIRELFGKPPNEDVAWIKDRYYAAILHYNPDDITAGKYAQQAERYIYQNDLEDEYRISDRWMEFRTSRDSIRDEAKKKGTLINV